MGGAQGVDGPRPRHASHGRYWADAHAANQCSHGVKKQAQLSRLLHYGCAAALAHIAHRAPQQDRLETSVSNTSKMFIRRTVTGTGTRDQVAGLEDAFDTSSSEQLALLNRPGCTRFLDSASPRSSDYTLCAVNSAVKCRSSQFLFSGILRRSCEGPPRCARGTMSKRPTDHLEPSAKKRTQHRQGRKGDEDEEDSEVSPRAPCCLPAGCNIVHADASFLSSS